MAISSAPRRPAVLPARLTPSSSPDCTRVKSVSRTVLLGLDEPTSVAQVSAVTEAIAADTENTSVSTSVINQNITIITNKKPIAKIYTQSLRGALSLSTAHPWISHSTLLLHATT